MGRLSLETQVKIIDLRSSGKGTTDIKRILEDDCVHISRWSILRFLRRYKERKSLENASKPGRPTKGVTSHVLSFIDSTMEANDEMTGPERTRRVNRQFDETFS